MDSLLAGYGSEDSSSSEREQVTMNDLPSMSGGNKVTNLVSGLVACYSDGENSNGSIRSDDDHDVEKQPKRQRANHRIESSSVHSTESTIHSSLPPPQLSSSSSSSNPFSSLIQFDTDYISRLINSDPTLDSNNTSPEQILRLKSMRQTFSSKNKSFASHLRSQKEFGNPHMFPSVVAHFGINANGSNLDDSLKGQFRKFEFIDRIVKAEEQSRIVAASSSNSSRWEKTDEKDNGKND